MKIFKNNFSNDKKGKNIFVKKKKNISQNLFKIKPKFEILKKKNIDCFNDNSLENIKINNNFFIKIGTSQKDKNPLNKSLSENHNYLINLFKWIIFLKYKKIKNFLENSNKTDYIINKVDDNGNNSMHILFFCFWNCYINFKKNVYKILKDILILFLEKGGNPLIKNERNINCLDIAIGLEDYKLITMIIFKVSKTKFDSLFLKSNNLINYLKSIPDFEIKFKWEIDSSVIPFLNFISPNDEITIIKYKESIYIKNSVVKIKGLFTKKRNISYIFNPLMNNNSLNINNIISLSRSKTFIINHSKKMFSDPLELISNDEYIEIIKDLLYCDKLKAEINLKDLNLVKNNIKTEKIKNQICKKLSISFNYNYLIFNKQIKKNSFFNYYSYIKKLNNSQFTGVFKSNLFNKINKKSDINPYGLHKNHFKNKLDINFEEKNIKSLKKKKILNLWMCDNFPIKLDQFIHIINFLSKSNHLFLKVKQILNNDIIQEIKNFGFPKKIQIPLSMSWRVNLVIEHINIINNPNKVNLDLFKINDTYKFETRKNLQKTMKNRNKRAFLTNLLFI